MQKTGIISIMSQFEDRHIDFVLKHYRHGRFDTRKAISRFKEANGIAPVSRRRWNMVISGMSAAAMLLVGVFLFMRSGTRGWTELSADVSNSICILPDSTVVTLAPGAHLSYREKDCRKVRMSGKVYFDVARDEDRPFEVDADGAFVRVLGTEFMVDDLDGSRSAKVYVSEGKVLFARDEKAEGIILTDGMGAILEDGAQMPVLEESADINAIAWQRGTFIFEDTSLEDVLSCLSDYYDVSFVADDLSKRLSGEFHTDDLDLIITLIGSALDVNITIR